jgi:lipopolysaccharide assembly protein B
MDIPFDLLWIKDNLLVIITFIITIMLIYFYLIEKDLGVKLSKKYRNSIFEAQSKIFLNATQYLIVGNRDLAIKEFLNAVDLNRETIETYFALGGLFRTNGETEKAISIHRSLIARDNISESTRLEALKELAIDFDKGGFIDKAIETYRDVLKINRDQPKVIQALCRIYEDIEDWDEAYNYRIMLSKVTSENQSDTISHILVQKAKKLFQQGNLVACSDELDDAFRFAPSVSAKILKLKITMTKKDFEESKVLFEDLLQEHSLYSSFILLSLEEKFHGTEKEVLAYLESLKMLKDLFLDLDKTDLSITPSLLLSKVRLLIEENKQNQAYDDLKEWLELNPASPEPLKAEFIKLLISLGKNEEAIKYTKELLDKFSHSLTRHYCKLCGFNADEIFWRCPQCHAWESIQFRWKV